MSFLELEGKAVIVAGGGGGIGAEIAKVLVNAGASVIVADKNDSSVERVVSELRTVSRNISGSSLDLSSDSSLKVFLADASQKHGSIFGVVNAVGIVGVGSALDSDFADYQRQLDVNLFCAMRLARAFVKLVTATPKTSSATNDQVLGSYVYISSIGAELAIPMRDAYCVSKSAGQMFHLNLANEVAKYGINVNVVIPGRTDTPSASERASETPSAATQMFATQRRAAMIPATTVAKSCAFLLCPDLIGYSGQKLIISEGADTTYRPSYEALERNQS